MNHLKNQILIIAFALLAISTNVNSQELTNSQKDKITSEINTAFEKSINAYENLSIPELAECVSDSLSAGFIGNGFFYQSFEKLKEDSENSMTGLKSQKINVVNKKITVLSDKVALLTASGNFSVNIEDGRVINGKFAWTFVYTKINDSWKIIHTHTYNF